MLELYNLSPTRIAAESAHWPNATLPALLQARAARTPARIAIEDGARALTYAELLARVQAVAAGLQAHGVRPGDVVAFQLPTTLDTIVK